MSEQTILKDVIVGMALHLPCALHNFSDTEAGVPKFFLP